MNAVVGNKYIDTFNNLNIEVSKKLEGEFEVEEIISTFGNFFFNKMFLDITSINNYKDLNNLKKLSMNINMDKVILFLDANDTISDSREFLSGLVSMGIYNFTKDSNSLMYLYDNPNSYRDVAYYQDIDGKEEVYTNDVSQDTVNGNKKVILGIKNVTESAGSTTLTYVIKRVLSDYYNTMAIGIDELDITYFNDKEAINIKEDDFDNVISKHGNVEFFIVDLDKSKKDHLCNEVLYLIEPSSIKLNKMLAINPNIFKELDGKKIILNKSLLSKKDILDFEVEANISVFYNIEPLNDKNDCSDKILPLLEKLGYVKVSDNSNVEEDNNSSKKGIFNLFRKEK